MELNDESFLVSGAVNYIDNTFILNYNIRNDFKGGTVLLLLKDGNVFSDGRFSRLDILIDDGLILDVAPLISAPSADVFDFSGKYIIPGFVDVHVHLREPGFSYKETVSSGSTAAAAGGYTAVCAMPNLSPVPDSIENIAVEINAVKKGANIHIYPYASLTKGEDGKETVDFDSLKKYAVAFSDDGKGVCSDTVMKEAMIKAKRADALICAHCEDCSPQYINSAESEYKQLERDISLLRECGGKYHMCHASCKKSIELIRQAKKDGLDITCETAPHYLLLCDEDKKDCGSFKMNPPLRSAADRAALIEALRDNTVDIIATDHAPHSIEEKSHGLNSLNGIVGLETAFPVLYTELVKNGIISFEKLIELMSISPRKRFGIKGGVIAENMPCDIAVLDIESEYKIDSSHFYSKGRSTPFDGMSVFGRCVMTMVDGRIVYEL